MLRRRARPRRPILAVGFALILGVMVVVLPQTANADCDEDSTVIEVGCNGETPGNGNNNGGGGGDDPCEYTWADPQAPPGTDGHTSGVGGAWYWKDCILADGPGGTLGSRELVWLTDPPSARDVAWSILASIRIERPRIGIVPDTAAGGKGLVGLPVWLWTVNAMPYWGSHTDTDGAPGGLTVTLTVRSTQIVWNMGDGQSVTCHSAGIHYDDRYGKSTPDGWCGHRYTKSSRNQPNGQYTITATTYWHATWSASNGQSGVIDQQRESQTNVLIDELQVVIG